MYHNRSGLWKHKSQCKNPIINNNKDEIQITTDLVIKLIEQNKELQQTLIEQNKTMMGLAEKAGNNNINFNNNKTFNLNLFLNETCKDAININDFISSIQIQLNDLEVTGRLGHVEGISKVVIVNLNTLKEHLRPIHCSHYKREVIYIKDNEEWTKDNDNKDKMKNIIKQIANKNMKKIYNEVKNGLKKIQIHKKKCITK